MTDKLEELREGIKGNKTVTERICDDMNRCCVPNHAQRKILEMRLVRAEKALNANMIGFAISFAVAVLLFWTIIGLIVGFFAGAFCVGNIQRREKEIEQLKFALAK